MPRPRHPLTRPKVRASLFACLLGAAAPAVAEPGRELRVTQQALRTRGSASVPSSSARETARRSQTEARPPAPRPAAVRPDAPGAQSRDRPASAQPSPAVQPRPEMSNPRGEAYQRLIERALREFQRENWREARVLFHRAHDLNPSARTLRGIGIVSYEMGDYAQAALALSAALADERHSLSEELRKECASLLVRARALLESQRLTRNDLPPWPQEIPGQR